MRKQYLTQPDGSIPSSVDLAALQAAGVRIVRPVAPPRTPGMVAIEGEPVQRDSEWWQTWREEPASPPPLDAVPEAVTPLQFRRALRQAGLYGAVIGYVSTQTDDVQDAWEYAVEIRRDDPLVAAAAAALGQGAEDLDNLFRAALRF